MANNQHRQGVANSKSIPQVYHTWKSKWSKQGDNSANELPHVVDNFPEEHIGQMIHRAGMLPPVFTNPLRLTVCQAHSMLNIKFLLESRELASTFTGTQGELQTELMVPH